MTKTPLQIDPDLRPDRRAAKLLLMASMVLLGLGLAPVVLETVSLCYAQWREVLDRPVDVRTPLLDSIQDQIETTRIDLWSTASSRFQRVPWNPKVVLAIGGVIMGIGIVMLRL